MKQRILLLLMLMISVGVIAQDRYIVPEGIIKHGDSYTISMPTTSFIVDVSMEYNALLSGPYARYAQKFLGVRAPLVDKINYAVTGATISLSNSEDQFRVADIEPAIMSVGSHSTSQDGFAQIQPDKMKMLVSLPEDAARDAANMIFSLRRSRVELITGYTGESVFGAGLDAALKEIARLEQEYLELFYGKIIKRTESKRFMVAVNADKQQYILCRFSPTKGFLQSSDISGDMIFMQITPTGNIPSIVEASSEDKANSKSKSKDIEIRKFRVAALSKCSVVYGRSELTQAILPVFEFGSSIEIVIPNKK